jgi:hypothetical protein
MPAQSIPPISSRTATTYYTYSSGNNNNINNSPLRSASSRGPRNPTLPTLPTTEKRLDLYNSSAPRDAVNSLSNKTANHTIWPKPHYVPTVVHRYKPNGGGRDLWIDGLATETKGIHFVSDTELYWQSKLGQPEFRGKCKAAMCSKPDRWLLYPGLRKVHNHPLIPQAATMAKQINAMPPVKRTVFSGQWRVVEERNNAFKCDNLLDQLLMEHHQPRDSNQTSIASSSAKRVVSQQQQNKK